MRWFSTGTKEIRVLLNATAIFLINSTEKQVSYMQEIIMSTFFFIFKCKISSFLKLSNKSKSELNTHKPKYLTDKSLRFFLSIFFIYFCQAKCHLKRNLESRTMWKQERWQKCITITNSRVLTDPHETVHTFEMCLTNICRNVTQHFPKIGLMYSSFGYPKTGASDNHCVKSSSI